MMTRSAAAAAASMMLLVAALGVAPSAALYGPRSDVVSLTDADFDKTVLKSDKPWIVEFYAPWCGHCKNLAPHYEKAAKALSGMPIGVAAVDCDASTGRSLAGKYGIQGFPTIKIFKPGSSKPVDYQGAREAKAIADEGVKVASQVMKQVVNERITGKKSSSSSSSGGGSKSGGKGVISLNESNFKSQVLDSSELWMVEFFAPWCGHCKKLAPEYETAANELSGKAKLGAVDCTAPDGQGLCQKYGVQGYPTLKIFGADKKNPEPYEGPRVSSGIVDVLAAKAMDFVDPPEVVQLVSEEVVKKNCEEKQICLIAFVPHILDSKAEGRNKYIDILNALAAKFKTRPWGFLWAEGGAQESLESSLGVGGFGYPAVVAVNMKRKVYAVSKEAFAAKNTGSFLDRVISGRESVSALQDFTIVATSPWDGKDGELIEEEEFSLDDLGM